MAGTRKHKGACACGAVAFTAEAPADYGTCHCGTCRRWAGGPTMAVNCGRSVEIAGDLLLWDSSDWAERASCAKCGSPIFYRLKGTGEHYMSLGAFDDQTGWTMTSQIFIDRKPGHFAFANETKTMTEAEVFAMVAAGEAPE